MATVVLIVILATLNVGVGYVLALYIHGAAIAAPQPSRSQPATQPSQQEPSTPVVATSTDGGAETAESAPPESEPSPVPVDEDDSGEAETETEVVAASDPDAPSATEGDVEEELALLSEEGNAPDASQAISSSVASDTDPADVAEQADDSDDEELFEKLSKEALGTIKTAAVLPTAEEPIATEPGPADASKALDSDAATTADPSLQPANASEATGSPEEASVAVDRDSSEEPSTDPAGEADGETMVESGAPEGTDESESAVADAEPLDSEFDEADVPPPWLGILKAAHEPESFVEAMLQAVRFELGQYRSELMRIDESLRPLEIDPSTETTVSAEQFQSLQHELLSLSRRYLSHQMLVVDTIKDSSTDWGDLAEAVASVESALTTAAKQIETTSQSLDSIDCNQAVQLVAQQFRDVLAILIDEVHEVYRAAEQSLVVFLLRDESQEAEQGLMVDGKTMLQNRAGLELVLRQWWRDDPNRVRSLSLVAVDVDHLRDINRKLGIAAGDRVMEIVAMQASELLRKNRGFDRAFRIDRRELILFLGDTGPHGAACAAERVRQTIRATRYEQAGQTYEVTVSCGVTDARSEDTVRTLVDRVLKTVRECKRNGGDRTLIDEGDGPVEIDPPDYRMQSQTVRLFD